jgi:DNA-binding transcriptional MerR regulator
MLRIGELAAASGVTRDALRYYERQGLLPRPGRTAGGFREYEGAAIDRIRFIKQAQAHGLTLREIRDLVNHQADAGRARCRHVRDLLARKITQLETRRRELDAFCHTLGAYLHMCDRALEGRAHVECPVVEDLGQTRGASAKRSVGNGRAVRGDR